MLILLKISTLSWLFLTKYFFKLLFLQKRVISNSFRKGTLIFKPIFIFHLSVLNILFKYKLIIHRLNLGMIKLLYLLLFLGISSRGTPWVGSDLFFLHSSEEAWRWSWNPFWPPNWCPNSDFDWMRRFRRKCIWFASTPSPQWSGSPRCHCRLR